MKCYICNNKLFKSLIICDKKQFYILFFNINFQKTINLKNKREQSF